MVSWVGARWEVADKGLDVACAVVHARTVNGMSDENTTEPGVVTDPTADQPDTDSGGAPEAPDKQGQK